MKSRMIAAILATMVATVSAEQHSMNDATFTERSYSIAFADDGNMFPTPLNQAQMDETKGEWGIVILRLAAFIAGAVIRAPAPVHAPAPPAVGPCPRGRNITCN